MGSGEETHLLIRINDPILLERIQLIFLFYFIFLPDFLFQRSCIGPKKAAAILVPVRRKQQRNMHMTAKLTSIVRYCVYDKQRSHNSAFALTPRSHFWSVVDN